MICSMAQATLLKINGLECRPKGSTRSKIVPLPSYPKQRPVRGVDWNQAKGIAYVEFRQLGSWAICHDCLDSIINTDIRQAITFGVNKVISTLAMWGRQVVDDTKFPIFLWYYANAGTLKE